MVFITSFTREKRRFFWYYFSKLLAFTILFYKIYVVCKAFTISLNGEKVRFVCKAFTVSLYSSWRNREIVCKSFAISFTTERVYNLNYLRKREICLAYIDQTGYWTVWKELRNNKLTGSGRLSRWGPNKEQTGYRTMSRLATEQQAEDIIQYKAQTDRQQKNNQTGSQTRNTE